MKWMGQACDQLLGVWYSQSIKVKNEMDTGVQKGGAKGEGRILCVGKEGKCAGFFLLVIVFLFGLGFFFSVVCLLFLFVCCQLNIGLYGKRESQLRLCLHENVYRTFSYQ